MRKKVVIATVVLLASVCAATARDSLKIGVTPAIATGIAYVAEQEGFFDKHDLDVEFITGNGGALIAGVVSRSMDIALPTVTTFLQAVDNGLPLSVIAGGSINNPTESRISLKSGTSLKTPADFVGKTVGVSSIGATLHVLFQQWLILGGVDPSKVKFVEVPFPLMADVIRKGTVDAVVTTEPFGSRIISSGAGDVGPDFTKVMPDGLPTLLFVADNGWIDKHTSVIEKFRAALNDTVNMMVKDPERAKIDSNVYLKMPADVIATTSVPEFMVQADPKRLDLWVKMMVPMGLLSSTTASIDLIRQ